jgi:hypothetical protein
VLRRAGADPLQDAGLFGDLSHPSQIIIPLNTFGDLPCLIF